MASSSNPGKPPPGGRHHLPDRSENDRSAGARTGRPWRWWLVAVVVPLLLALMGSPFLVEWWQSRKAETVSTPGAETGTRCLLRNEMLSLGRPRPLPGGLVITLLESESKAHLPYVDFILEGTASQDGQVTLFADGVAPVELEDTGRRYDITVSDIRDETARFTVCP